MIFLSAHAKEGIEIIKALRMNGIHNIIFGPDAMAKESLINTLTNASSTQIDYTKNILISAPLLYDSANANALKYHQSYQKLFNQPPDWRGAFTYDTMNVIFNILQQLPQEIFQRPLKEQRTAVLSAIQQLNSPNRAIKGTTGFNFFDRDGNSEKAIFVGTIQNNSLTSAPEQLRQASKSTLENITINQKPFTKTSIIYSGFHLNSAKHLNLTTNTIELDFMLWFKTTNPNINLANIHFNNATVQPSITATKKHSQINVIINAYILPVHLILILLQLTLPLDPTILALIFGIKPMINLRLFLSVITSSKPKISPLQ